MSVLPSLAQRVLVVLLIVAATVCALASQHPLETSAAADISAGTPAETASTAAVLAESMVNAVGTQTNTSEAHGVIDCRGTACGNAHACVQAVALVDASPTSLVRTGVDLVEQTGRRPLLGHLVPAESGSPPWTVLSLTQLSVSRI